MFFFACTNYKNHLQYIFSVCLSICLMVSTNNSKSSNNTRGLFFFFFFFYLFSCLSPLLNFQRWWISVREVNFQGKKEWRHSSNLLPKEHCNMLLFKESIKYNIYFAILILHLLFNFWTNNSILTSSKCE